MVFSNDHIVWQENAPFESALEWKVMKSLGFLKIMLKFDVHHNESLMFFLLTIYCFEQRFLLGIWVAGLDLTEVKIQKQHLQAGLCSSRALSETFFTVSASDFGK